MLGLIGGGAVLHALSPPRRLPGARGAGASGTSATGGRPRAAPSRARRRPMRSPDSSSLAWAAGFGAGGRGGAPARTSRGRSTRRVLFACRHRARRDVRGVMRGGRHVRDGGRARAERGVAAAVSAAAVRTSLTEGSGRSVSTDARSVVRRSSAFVWTMTASPGAAAAWPPDGSTNDAVASMSVSASPRATTAVTSLDEHAGRDERGTQDIVGRAITIRVRAVTTVAGGSIRRIAFFGCATGTGTGCGSTPCAHTVARAARAGEPTIAAARRRARPTAEARRPATPTAEARSAGRTGASAAPRASPWAARRRRELRHRHRLLRAPAAARPLSSPSAGGASSSPRRRPSAEHARREAGGGGTELPRAAGKDLDVAGGEEVRGVGTGCALGEREHGSPPASGVLASPPLHQARQRSRRGRAASKPPNSGAIDRADWKRRGNWKLLVGGARGSGDPRALGDSKSRCSIPCMRVMGARLAEGTPGRLESRQVFGGGRRPREKRLNQGFVIEDHEPP